MGAVGAPAFALAAILLQLVDLLCWRVCCGKCIETYPSIIGHGISVSDIFGLWLEKLLLVNRILTCGDRNCYISTGGIYTIVAFSFYFMGGIVGCFTPEPTPILCREHKHESDEE